MRRAGYCPRCHSEAFRLKHRADDLGWVCSPDCVLDDMDLAIRNEVRSILGKPTDEVDWSDLEGRVERILRGQFNRPYRPHTYYR